MFCPRLASQSRSSVPRRWGFYCILNPARSDAMDFRSQGDDQKGHLTGALPCMRKRPPSFLAINQIVVLRPLTKRPPCIISHLARRFGRKLQTPFIGFGKGQSHESFGRSERPADRGEVPVMRTWPPSLAIQIFAPLCRLQAVG